MVWLLRCRFAGREIDALTHAAGVCFLSYSRKRADEAALLVAALRDHGVPTWQDISHLASGQTEEELRHILTDENTSSAILFVTPEVESSDFIRIVEAPLIFKRHLERDGFWIFVVAAGGLHYGDVSRVLGPRIGPIDPGGWNIQKLSRDPITAAEAAKVAEIALNHRLDAVSKQLAVSVPLKLALSTRAELPIKPGS